MISSPKPMSATKQGKAAGEDFLYRNDSHEGDGTRIQMRLRRQPKRDDALKADAVKTTTPATPGVVLPQGIDVAAVTAAVIAALSAAAPTAEVVPTSAAANIPEDIKAELGML